MEQDPLHLENVVAVDPKIDLEETFRPVNVISKGGVNRSLIKIPASGAGNSNWVWNNITPPSMSTVMEKSLRVQYQFKVTCTYSTPAGNPAVPAYPNFPVFPAIDTRAGNTQGKLYLQQNASGCLRAFPLQQALSTISVRINGTPCDGANQDWISVYPLLLSDDESSIYCSEFPCQADDSALYSQPSVQGRSPFSVYSGNTAKPSRASFLGRLITSVAAGGTTTDVYIFEVVEQIILSPFSFGRGLDSMGLANIFNLTINMKFSDPNRLLSVMPSAFTITEAITPTVTCTFEDPSLIAPNLLVEYTSPDPVLAMRMPPELILPYELFETNITPGGIYTNVALAKTQIVANSLQMASIPEKVFIFVRPSRNSLQGSAAMTTPDTFLRITGLNITWGNRIGLFSSYTERDLLKCSQSNGSKQDYHSWAYRTGSIMMLDVAKDIGLEADQASGQPNTYSTMSIQVNVDNAPLAYAGQAAQIQYDLYVIVVKSGKIVISKTGAQQVLVGPDGQEVLRAVDDVNAKVDSTELKSIDRAQGGSLLSGAAKLLHRGLSLVKHVKPEHLAYLHQGAEIARKGLAHLGIGGAVVGGKIAGRHKRIA